MTTDKIIKRIAERIYDRMAESGDPMPVRTHDIILAELAPLREALEAAEAVEANVEYCGGLRYAIDSAHVGKLSAALANLKTIGGDNE